MNISNHNNHHTEDLTLSEENFLEIISSEKTAFCQKIKNVLRFNWINKIEIDELFRKYENALQEENISLWMFLKQNYQRFYTEIEWYLSVNLRKKENTIQVWELLVFLWDITEKQLAIALWIQKTSSKPIEIWKLLVKNGCISLKRYAEVGAWFWFIKLWEYLLFNWILPKEKIIECLTIVHNNKAFSLWEVLLQKWYITPDVLYPILKELKIIRTWEYFILQNKITQTDLHEAMTEQERTGKTIWDILVLRKKITQTELFEYLSFIGKPIQISELSLI